jgi:hypothetical protein
MADFGSASFAVSQSVSSFMQFLPKITEVRKASVNDEDFCYDLRIAEIAGTVITIGVGMIVSSMTQSSAPIVAGLFISLVIVILYETVLRKEAPDEKAQKLTLIRNR